MPFWHPKGMVLWNVLEDLRRRENAEARLRRGEDAAHLRHRDLEDLGPLGEVPRRTCSSCRYGEDRTLGLKPMNCPGHMLLFGSDAPQLPRAADALRRVVDAAPQRARRHAARPPARAARHAGRRAHLRARRSRSRTRSSAASTSPRTSTTCSGWRRASSSRRGPDNKLGTDEEWDFTEGALRGGARAARDRVHDRTRATARSTGRRSTCT